MTKDRINRIMAESYFAESAKTQHNSNPLAENTALSHSTQVTFNVDVKINPSIMLCLNWQMKTNILNNSDNKKKNNINKYVI